MMSVTIGETRSTKLFIIYKNEDRSFFIGVLPDKLHAVIEIQIQAEKIPLLSS